MIFLTIQFILAAMSVTGTIFHHAMRKRANLSIKIQRLPSIKRLPTYLRELKVVRKEGREVISAAAMAERLEMEAIVVRKDLEITGATGYPGIGYDINDLIEAIESFLGWNNSSDVFLVGAGALGTALLGYSGFVEYGLNIVAAFDIDPAKVNTFIHDVPVYPMKELPHLTNRLKIKMAILCVPCDYAQETADKLVDAGILAIWNFTNVKLIVPDNVVRQRVNLAGELAVLSVKLSERLKQLYS